MEEPTRTKSPRAPVVVLAGAFGLLMLVLVVIVVHPSAAPEPQPPADRSQTTPEPDAPPETRPGEPDRPSTDTTELDVDRIHSLVSEGFEDDYAPHVDPAEADCLAEAVLVVLGPDRLLRLTEEMASASGDPDNADRSDPDLITPDEDRQLDRHMRPCVDNETATRLDL